MNAPFYQLDAFGYPTAMALATLIGFGFGFVLERAGFGRSTVLAAQFYGRDMRVLKVMFTAIATAAVGLALLSAAGLLDLGAVQIPETWLWPQLVGGLLLGVGFIVAGYCPGTAVVGAATGYLDGLWTLFGVAAGALVFGFSFPAGFYERSAMGVVTLPEALHLPWAAVAALVVAMAIGAFLFAEKVERSLALKDHAAPPAGAPLVRNRVFAGLAIAAGLAAGLAALPRRHASESELVKLSPLSAVELAQTLAAGIPEVYLVDARAPDICRARPIPGALCLSAEDPSGAFIAQLPPTRALVLYGASVLDAVPAGAKKYAGPVQVVEGGFQAWQLAVLEPPAPPASATPEDLASFRHRAALHAHFTGQAAPKPVAPAVIDKPIKRAVKKGGGC